MRFGLYYYPWYKAARWRQHEKRQTPRIGEYNSADPILIRYHVNQIIELGADYVIVEILPQNDWDFAENFSAACSFVKELQASNIAHTFLIDTATGKGHKDSCAGFGNLLNELREADVMPTVVKGGRPLLFCFSTTVPETLALHETYGRDFSLFLPIFLRDWNIPDLVNNALVIERGASIAADVLRWEMLPLAGFFQFWADTPDICNFNGFVPVIPGYDDRLLRRDPQLAPLVPRDEGNTLVAQFHRAVSLGAEDILLYGWNEYFEATTIEPTLEEGDFYFHLTRELIAQVKRGEAVHMPDNMDRPKSAPVLYLTPELENLGRREPDGVPRWDAWDYAAEIENIPEEVLEDGYAVFHGVRVKNAGTKPWPVASETAPIRLGIRLVGKDGETLREGRAELGDRDIAPGMTFVTNLRLKLAGLDRLAGGTLVFGVVWEHRFWFEGEISETLIEVKNEGIDRGQ
jgi:hypothetical protein